MRSYDTRADLADYYFEDSYVLGIDETETRLAFDLDVVLTERHPEYRAPRPGEQYCYRRGVLAFTGFSGVEWLERSGLEFTDASGEVDLGSIDSFRYDDGDPAATYELEGDWGHVRVVGGDVGVTLQGDAG